MSYRLCDEKQRWSLRHAGTSPEACPDYNLIEGEVIVCLHADIESPEERRIFSRHLHRGWRLRGVWMVHTGVIVYDSPIEDTYNDGREDNLMNFLVEL